MRPTGARVSLLLEKEFSDAMGYLKNKARGYWKRNQLGMTNGLRKYKQKSRRE